METLKDFYQENDYRMEQLLKELPLLDEKIDPFQLKKTDKIEEYEIIAPTEEYRFLHEAAIIEYKGTLFASWYNCPSEELYGRTPIRGKRSKDGGKTWSEVEVIIDNGGDVIRYCPPVYGIDGRKLYMLVNEMVAPDCIHALDLLIYNEETDKFEMVWSKPVPVKINTNVYKLNNGKLLLPGRLGKLDEYTDTPCVLISDSGKIDAEWRIVKVLPDKNLPNGDYYHHPENSAIVDGDKVYLFSRNDMGRVPLIYISEDNGETWSAPMRHQIPFSNSKMYSGTLSNGRNYVIGNLQPWRWDLAIFFTDKNSMVFNTGYLLQEQKPIGIYSGKQWSYPVAYEADGKLYVIYSAEVSNHFHRGAWVSVVPIDLDETVIK